VATPLQSFGGLASGLDTAAIITQLIAVERAPQTRLAQKQQVEEARAQTLRDVSTRISNLATAIASLGDVATWGDVQSVESSDPTRLGVVRTSGAAPGAYQVEVSQLARANRWDQAAGPTAAAGADVIHITVGSGPSATTTNVAIGAGDTLATIAGKINGTSGTPVYASVVDGKIVLANKTTGTEKAITAVTTDGGSGLAFGEAQVAKDAQFTIDGTGYTRASNVVADVPALAGVTLTLKGLIAPENAATVTVGAPAPDSARIQAKIQEFVTQYNATVEFIHGKLTEKKVASPTTATERAKGVLAGDAGLSGLLSKLRQAVGDVVGGRPTDLQQLAQAGLSTGKTTGSGTLNQDAVAGKLTLDAAKLTEQLTARFADVKALFTNATGVAATQGLQQRLDGIVKPWIASSGASQPGILSSRISGSEAIVTSLKSQQAAWDDRLAARERQLREQFTTLETALAKAQSQGSWLSSQLAQLGG
jgi:flagellar hook-associated protein 2